VGKTRGYGEKKIGERIDLRALKNLDVKKGLNAETSSRSIPRRGH